VLKPVLEEFISQKYLVFRNETYFYCKEKQTEKPLLRLPLIFQYHSRETIDMIMKAFCADIPSTKTMLLIEKSDNSICKFNHFFREFLYKQQYQELMKLIEQKPQTSYVRNFFETKMYFYTYNGRVFIASKPINNNAEKYADKKSLFEFKKVYSFITRDKELYKFLNCLEYRIAEKIWRRNRNYRELLTDLNFIIGN